MSVHAPIVVPGRAVCPSPPDLLGFIPAGDRPNDQGRAQPSTEADTPGGESEIGAGIMIHLPRLHRYGFMLSRQRDVADDLVQATVVRALERRGQFQAGTRLDRWLSSILYSIWINELRARKVRVGRGVVDAGDVLILDGRLETETRVLANQLLRIVDTLPEAQRTTVRLAYVEGLSYREIAEQTQVPLGTVMSRLARARTKLGADVVPRNADRASD